MIAPSLHCKISPLRVHLRSELSVSSTVFGSTGRARLKPSIDLLLPSCTAQTGDSAHRPQDIRIIYQMIPASSLKGRLSFELKTQITID